jgi:hypothetical protein
LVFFGMTTAGIPLKLMNAVSEVMRIDHGLRLVRAC